MIEWASHVKPIPPAPVTTSMRASIVLLIVLAASAAFAQASNDPLLSVSRPHLQYFAELHESELFLVMNVMADSLGVNCDYCHVRNVPPGTTTIAGGWDWKNDAKKEKAVGRDMMAMVQLINKTSFGGRPVVTCQSCHRGSLKVDSRVSLPPLQPAEREHGVQAPLPTVADLQRRYRKAIGVEEGVVKPIAVAGVTERSEGRKTEFEIEMVSPDDFSLRLKTPPVIQRITPNGGCTGDKTLSASDRQRVKDATAIYAADKIANVSLQTVSGVETIRGHKAYVVDAAAPERQRKMLYFDADTGLLLRTLTLKQTAVLELPEQADYDDYRDAAGGSVKVPFLIITSDAAPYDTATRRIATARIGKVEPVGDCAATP